MHTYTLSCALVAPVTIGQAFEVFENPYNLSRITPPWLNFRIATKNLEMRQGAEIDYTFRWLVLPMKWKTRITRYEPPYVFVDEALRSPYLLWHHEHNFQETSGGTRVADRVTYSLPFGLLGRLAHNAAVQHQLRAIFQYRQKAILQLLHVEPVILEEPAITSEG